jgi:tryptophan 2,3-dioxygenase
MLRVFSHDAQGHAGLQKVLTSPSLYDEFLQYLSRFGHAVPATHLQRDWSLPHVSDPGLLPVFEAIYENTDRYWREYSLCEDFVDLESQFQLWRFRHMRTVLRIIGFKRGTGGSSGVGFLRQALELTFFPELFEVRTLIDGKPGSAY